MAEGLKADLIILKVRQGLEGQIAEVLVRRNEIEGLKLDLRIILLGDQCSGKSTLIGVLISGKKDNGKGLARMNVFRHKHEINRGHTSSISHQILGFDSKGEVTNQNQFQNLSWAQIMDRSTKILTFIDVAGHEKYTKTMISGMCHYPDYAIIVVGADTGVTKAAESHFKLAFAYKVPVFIAVTKIDAVSKDQLNETTLQIKSLIKENFGKKIGVVVKSNEDVVLFSRNLTEKTTPIFHISNVTGAGMELFLSFLNLLPVNPGGNDWVTTTGDSFAEFHISDTFEVDGEVIFAGTMLKGIIRVYQRLLLGPDLEGNFKPIEIRSIHCNRVRISSVFAGQICTFGVNLGKFAEPWLKKNGGIRKGMVLIDTKANPKATRSFDAEIWTFDNTIKIIKPNYQPIINTQHIRQAAMIVSPTQLDKQSDLEISPPKSKMANSFSLPESSNQGMNSINSREDIKIEEFMKHSTSIGFFKSNEAERPRLNSERNEIEISSHTRTKLRFRFMYGTEYLTPNNYLIINDSYLKAFGQITHIYYDS